MKSLVASLLALTLALPSAVAGPCCCEVAQTNLPTCCQASHCDAEPPAAASPSCCAAESQQTCRSEAPFIADDCRCAGCPANVAQRPEGVLVERPEQDDEASLAPSWLAPPACLVGSPGIEATEASDGAPDALRPPDRLARLCVWIL